MAAGRHEPHGRDVSIPCIHKRAVRGRRLVPTCCEQSDRLPCYVQLFSKRAGLGGRREHTGPGVDDVWTAKVAAYSKPGDLGWGRAGIDPDEWDALSRVSVANDGAGSRDIRFPMEVCEADTSILHGRGRQGKPRRTGTVCCGCAPRESHVDLEGIPNRQYLTIRVGADR